MVHRPASNMHPMTYKLKLIRAAVLLLFGAALADWVAGRLEP